MLFYFESMWCFHVQWKIVLSAFTLIFFRVLFGFRTTNSGLLSRGLHPSQDINCVLFEFWLKNDQEPRNEVEFLSPAACPVRFEPKTFWSLYITSTRGATLPKDQPYM